MNTVCLGKQTPCSQKNLEKQTKRREKIQNEHCLSGQHSRQTCSQKKLKKLEKQTKRRREKIQNEQAWIGCQPSLASLVRKKRRKKKEKKKTCIESTLKDTLFFLHFL